MTDTNGMPADLLEYFRALRTEIIEAQKLRVQIGLAKTVFLGTLLGIFFKSPDSHDLTILICPFVALAFDCMVYGLSFNIRDIGNFIGKQIETKMGPRPCQTWQRYRAKRESKGIWDWGRIAYRLGSYLLSAAVSVVSFTKARPPAGTELVSWGWVWRIGLMTGLTFVWCALICADFPSIKRRLRALRKGLSWRYGLKRK